MRTRTFHSVARLVLALAIAIVLFAMVPAAQAQGEASPAQVPGLVGGATLSAPTGTIFANKPTYTWNAVVDSTWYYLWVSKVNANGSLTTVHTKWYAVGDPALVCSSGTCSVTPNIALAPGNYRWWIQTWNQAGYGPWSDLMNFTAAVPAAPGLVSPTGDIGANYTPTYTWNKVTGATWYYLWVSKVGANGSLSIVYIKWHESASVCGASTCSVTPAGVNLSGGAHRFWVQTWNDVGYGSWSTGLDFSTLIPGAATLVSPSGSITDTTPTYTWNQVTGATWYYLWVTDPTGNVIKQWYDASLICTGATCSVTPGIAVGPGSTTWWVQSWNIGGYGAWSAGMPFSIPTPWPAKPTVISPITTANDFTPTYSWNAVSSQTGVPASWYLLSMNGPGGNLITQWYTAAATGCSSGTGTCSVTPSTVLFPGSTYTWQVRGWNEAGDGPWSDLVSFSLSSIGGFDSQFNGSAPGWTPYSGSWGIANNAWYGAYGSNYQYVTSAYTGGDYSNLDVQARVITDTPDEAVMIVRGTPSPVDEYGDWYSGYYFAFDGNGFYAVGKMVNGYWTALQPWTYTASLIPGNWNVLRVVAIGNSLYYYINGTLVWSGVDYSLTSGKVGFELGTDPSHSLWIDWVTLSSYYARAVDMSIVADVVSPEQQALNEAALNGSSEKAPGRSWK